MAKCNRKTHPDLFGYLEAYGLDARVISRIDRIKGNPSSGYYVVGWPENGMVSMLDISNTPDRSKLPAGPNAGTLERFGWNMLNDGMDPVTEKDWNKIKIWPYCEGFTIEGHEDYG